MILNLRKIYNFTLWIWIFLIPFQLFLTKGLSISVSLLLLLLNLALFLLIVFRNSRVKRQIVTLFISQKIILLLGGFVLISFFVNSFINPSFIEVKELLRWALFVVQYLLVYLSLKLGYLNSSSLLKGIVAGSFLLVLTSLYQPFVSVSFEQNVVENFGSLFNDPDLMNERLSGIGKFNWIYGDVVRSHGVLANVSHFAFIVGLGLLALNDLHFSRKKSVSRRILFVSLILAIFLHLSLVRSTFLVLLLVCIVNILLWLKNRNKDGFRLTRLFFVGFILAGLIGVFTYQYSFAIAILTRIVELVTLDGLWLKELGIALSDLTARIGLNTAEFNEYGGVGGRLYIFNTTINEIVLPNLVKIPYILFGFGPGSFGHTFRSAIADTHYQSFGSADNSYLFWLVEFGVTPFLFAINYLLINFKSLIARYSGYWYWIIFLLVEMLFKDTLPDIRMSAMIAVVLAYIHFKAYEKE